MQAGPFLIDERELIESFARASGPGGQNVNKVSTAVELRFDARRSPALPVDVAERLIHLAGQRATLDGVIVIFAQRFASQPRNREDARARLAQRVGVYFPVSHLGQYPNRLNQRAPSSRAP